MILPPPTPEELRRRILVILMTEGSQAFNQTLLLRHYFPDITFTDWCRIYGIKYRSFNFIDRHHRVHTHIELSFFDDSEL